MIKEDGSLEELIVGTIIDFNISKYSNTNFLEENDSQYSILVNKSDHTHWERISIPTANRLTSLVF